MAASLETRVGICRLGDVPWDCGWESTPVAQSHQGCLFHGLIALKGDLGLEGRAGLLAFEGLNCVWKRKKQSFGVSYFI